MVMTHENPNVIQKIHSHRFEIKNSDKFPDPKALMLLKSIREYYQLEIDDVQLVRVYKIKTKKSLDTIKEAATHLLYDPIIEEMTQAHDKIHGDWVIETSLKPGVTDNTGKIAQLTFEDYFNEPFEDHESISFIHKYILKAKLSESEVESIATGLLANPLIEDIKIYKANVIQNPVEELITNCELPDVVETIHLVDADEQTLKQISSRRHLALNALEMQTIQQHYSTCPYIDSRIALGLSNNPTDVELEVFAQTWSEHCKHKIFNANIQYTEDGISENIESLFKSYIKKSTEEISQSIDWLISVFTDNAGIIKFNDEYSICFKVETHNSPSALDPFGGALTGILGVNRDIMGAGIGARLIANTNILCFASPDYSGTIPERLMHPRRVMEGVCRGIEQGGNKSGIPTVNGSICFDERFLGKPLVYCGSVGIMPAKIGLKDSHSKEILNGDLIVIAGGRTGKDGIHGATFSSEALHAESPSTAVQIGDPFTQKKLHDFLIEARNAGLYRTLTDNGAGGFSSSVGELATLSGGCKIHLDQVLLKQPGLTSWEILVSESQERMTLAVPPECQKALFALAHLHEVEIFVLGTFTGTGFFHVLNHQNTVAYIDMHFLHEGLPKMFLEAEWHTKKTQKCNLPDKMDYTSDLHDLLSSYNICSKETIVRQYDHEVQGGSILKPFVGIENDGPGDAGVLCPIETIDSYEGIVIGHGLCPRYSDEDAYKMCANAIDEAIRNCVAVGGDPHRIAILDNFCWPDPVYHEVNNPDGKEKLAQLVRANIALYVYSKAFMTPIISGKDSMKNDYMIGNIKISVPPTLLISAIGKINDVRKCITMDVKQADDLIYIVGFTKNEMGKSEYAAIKNLNGGSVPEVDAILARKIYADLHNAINKGLVASCHDCSEGGLAVALAESSFAGGLGIDVSLDKAPLKGSLSNCELLFSESASRFVVTVNPEYASDFERCFQKGVLNCVGNVSKDKKFKISGFEEKILVDCDIFSLKNAWQNPLKVKL